MIYELTDTSKVKPIFEGWNETLIYSCLQKVMGKIYVTDPDSPVSAMAHVGCFAFYGGATPYTRYKEGIEIEVDTVEEERRNGLATAVSAALILQCLDEGLYPSWDAQNMNSVHLAEKLGYEFDHEYTAYEVSGEERTH